MRSRDGEPLPAYVSPSPLDKPPPAVVGFRCGPGTARKGHPAEPDPSYPHEAFPMRSLMALTTALVGSALVAPAAFAQDERSDWLDIELGKSVVLETPRLPTAIAVTNPEVANPVSLGVANKIQIQGLSIGTTDLVVQFGAGVPPMRYEITVHRDISDLVRRVDSIVEGEPPRVYPLEDRIVVEGPVPDLDTLERVAMVARLYDENWVNLMTVEGDHQVQLEVLFAEVSRTGLRELGLNALWGDSSLAVNMIGPNSAGNNVWTHTGLTERANGGLVPAAGVGGFSVGTWIQQLNLVAVVQLLDDYSLGKILAQPTLLALSGQQAEFHAGGEVPIPSPSGGSDGRIRIEFKKHGIQLVFVPTVLANDVIDVRMSVEVSEIDHGNSTRITGIEIPGFLTRRGSTHLRIENGMTFAIAGMLSDTVSYQRTGIPGLGRLPLVGTLFRATSHMREETELVIYVTPRLVRPLAPGEVPAAPGTTENNNPSDFELFFLGMDHRPGSRTASPTGAVGLQR